MKEEKQEEKAPLRMAGTKRGVVRQKMMSFRLDGDLVAYLETKPNKGRFINDLVRQKMKFDTTLD